MRKLAKRSAAGAIASLALVAAMAPGVATAAPSTARVEGGCFEDSGLSFPQFIVYYLDTSVGMSFGQVKGGFARAERTCNTPNSYAFLYVDGVLVDSWVNS